MNIREKFLEAPFYSLFWHMSFFGGDFTSKTLFAA
jgi:hypothetical protein